MPADGYIRVGDDEPERESKPTDSSSGGERLARSTAPASLAIAPTVAPQTPAQESAPLGGWIPFVRPLGGAGAGHVDRVKACCSLVVTAEQYSTLTAHPVWPLPRSPEEEAVKFLVETHGWGMEKIEELRDALAAAGDDSPRNLFAVRQFEAWERDGRDELENTLRVSRARGLNISRDVVHVEASPDVAVEGRRTEAAVGGAHTATDSAARAHLAVSCADDDTLKLWDMTTGNCIRTFYGHTQIVRGCRIIIDPTHAASDALPKLLSCSADLTLKVWDLATGLCLRTLGEAPQLRSNDARESLHERRRATGLSVTKSRSSFGSSGSPSISPTNSLRSQTSSLVRKPHVRSAQKSTFEARKQEIHIG
jgi:WD40 repeat protein